MDDQAAGLLHGKLRPASTVRQAIEAPLPTGLALRRRRFTHRLRQRAAGWMSRPLSALERLPGLGHRVRCPICGWEGGWYRPQVSGGRIRWSVRCPGCRAGRRHRLFWLAWQERARDVGLCLHMAPENWLAPLVAAASTAVVTMDIEARDVDINADAEALPLPDHRIDTIVCNDVLEHVEDDGRALREIARVLAPAGVAFLHTPVVSTETVEYGYANPIDHGHRRAYGPDLVARIRAAGLQLSLFRVSDLDPRDRRRYGLPVPDAVIIARRAA